MLFLWCYICPYYYSLGFWWVIVSLFQSYLESFRSNHWATQMAQQVKNPRAMQETQETGVWSLGWEDSLKKEMATHSNILAWKIQWTEESGRLQFKASQRVKHN